MLNEDINRFLGVLSYPFCSLDFLHDDFLDDYIKKDEPAIKDKEKLRKKTTDYINKFYTVYSYDEIYLYLEKWYLYSLNVSENKPKSSFEMIYRHLKNLSTSFISQLDGRIIYKYWDNEHDKELLGGFAGDNKIYLFHSLNRLMPLDILSIIYMAENNKSHEQLHGYYGNLQVADVYLDKILSNGVAENHLHCGVSESFLTSWDNYMKPLSANKVKAVKKFPLRFLNGFDDTRNSFYVWLAGILRAVILLYIKEKKQDCYYKKIAEYYAGNCKTKGWKAIYDDNGLEKDKDMDFFLGEWRKILNEYDEDLNDFIKSAMEKDDNLHTSEENLFLFKVIEFINGGAKEKDGSKLATVELLFLNYLRIKNYIYRMLVQQKKIRGLDYFQQFYDRNSEFNKAQTKKDSIHHWEQIIREQFQNKNLQKLELRTSIDNKEKDFENNVNNFLYAYKNIICTEEYCYIETDENGDKKYSPKNPFPKVALVFHLLKKEQEYLPEKCIRIGEYSHLQYGEIYNDYQIKVAMLKKLRSTGLDKYLVGLDVASLETAIPTWVFANIFKNARDSSIENLKSGYNSFQSLSFTFHAGEDFRHLFSGLRRIEEVVRYLKFHAGDRIGHGVALGISVEEWRCRNPIVIITRIEALDNYLWAYNLLSQEVHESTFINIAYLEKRIYELSAEIYNTGGNFTGLTTNLLVSAYIKLFKNKMFDDYNDLNCQDCPGLNKNGLPLCEAYKKYKDNGNGFIWTEQMLLDARHCKTFVDEMNEPIHYKFTAQEASIVEELQKLVKQYINRQGIIVEINPSSNVAIGEIDTLSKHQVYNINNYSHNFGNIMTCINSDDPSVFNTNVSNELAYIYFGMLEKNIDREQTLLWIDKIRKIGMDTSFIRRNDSDKQIIHELNNLIPSL